MIKKLSTKIFILFTVLLTTLITIGMLTHDRSNITKESTKNCLASNIKIVLYIKYTCPYCNFTQKLLNEKNIPYKIVELTNNKDLHIKLINQTGQRTVPYIFINDNFIGGSEDLQKLDSDGLLDKMCNTP